MTPKLVIPIAPARGLSSGRSVSGQGASGQERGAALAMPPPLSLYVHFPWCVRKCPYCDFNSHEVRGDIPEQQYLAALIDDLEAALPEIWGRRVISVFIGGGTPSLLSGDAVDALLTAIRARLSLLADAEVTLEANPGAVDAAKFAAFRAAGINRISLGIQSFNDRHLEALGRIHSAADARRAIEAALSCFDNVNIDLMYGLPGQTLAEAQHDLSSALAFAPQHLSAYHLTIEPHTAFHHAPPRLPDEELAADMQEAIDAGLREAGYQHYEISAYTKPGQRCRHNLNYWQFGDYLGIGPGAHGKLSTAEGIMRQARRRHPEQYLRGDFMQERRLVAPQELPFEFMINALRLTEGVPRALFEQRTGLSLSVAADALMAAGRRGLLDVDAEVIRATALGRRFLNDLLQLFLPAR